MDLKAQLPQTAEARAQVMTVAREAAGGDIEAWRAVCPVAFTAQVKPDTDLADPDTFLQPKVEISATVNPLFHSLLVELGAEPNGLRTYEISAGKGDSEADRLAKQKAICAILKVLPGEICYPANLVDEGLDGGFQQLNTRHTKSFSDIWNLIRSTPAGADISIAKLSTINQPHPESGPLAGCAISLNASKGRIYLTVLTNFSNKVEAELTDGTPDYRRLLRSGRMEPQDVLPDHAVAMLEQAAAEGFTVLDSEGDLGLLRRVLSKMVVAQTVPGSPGKGRLVVGSEVHADLGKAEASLSEADGASTRSALLPAGEAGEAVEAALAAGAVATIHPKVADVIRMSQAKKVKADPKNAELRLRDYQREGVGLHLSTEVGFLQCCSVGLGKTAMTLRGMRECAAAKRKQVK